MSLRVVRRPIRAIFNPSINVLKTPSIRGLHITKRLLQDQKKTEKDGKDEKINAEIRKLKELKETYRNAGFFEKLKLHSQLLKQEAKVTEAQESKLNANIPAPVMKFDEDPMSVENLARYQVIYSFMLTTFVRECEAYTRPQSVNFNPDALIDDIIDSFKEFHPEYAPVTKNDVLFYFHVYHFLLNNIIFMDELNFEDPVVAKLLNSYVSMNPEDNATEQAKKVADEMNVNEDVVIGWFNIFSILSSTPFAKPGQKYTCSLCPTEYARFQVFNSQVDAIQDKFSKIYNDAFKKSNSANTKQNSNANPGLNNFIFQNNDSKKNSQDDKKNGKNKNNKDKKSMEFEINLNGSPMKYFQLGLLGGLLMYVLYNLSQDSDNEISFQKFAADFLSKNLVSRLVVVNNKTVIVELNDNGKAQYGNHQGRLYFNVGSIESFERSLRHVQEEYKIAEQVRVPVVYVNEGNTTKMLINFLPTILFLGAIYYMTKKASMGGMGGPLGFGKSTAKKFNQETDIKIRFKDVAGMSEAKEEVMEFVKFLKNPEKYEKLGAKIPRGAILSGPPGTGKTLIAKATAGEADVPFYSVSGSEFVEMFVGVGASRVRDLFKTARENAPSIVFVDEIDAIGKQRSKGNASGANDERETTLNQLLVEMDGFESSDHVVVLAGTNRADILDKALMRPGRFDRHIAIDNPELLGRKEIFQVHLKKITLAKNIDHDLPGRLAALTPGFSGADIANVCNEAALIGARFNAEAVTSRHFELAIERVIGGIEKKSKILNAEEQRVVAYHEAGHAVCGWFLKHAHPLLKVSIIPRGQGALGYAQYLPPDQYLMSALQLEDRMIMTLGGRVSEELHFDSVTSGAHDDFKKVTNIAQSMVLRFGMSKRVGMVNYADTQSQDNLTKPFSDETNSIIDEEIQRIVRECYQKCADLLKEKSHEVELVAQELLRKEYITREDMIRLLGKRPFPETNDAFDKYLDGKDVFKNEKPADEKKDDAE